MKRSKRFVFVPFCLLSQGVRAQGIVKKFPSVVKPVVSLLADLDINIVQMPCPELFFDGLHRRPCGKPRYDNPHNRAVCRKIGNDIAEFMTMLRNGGYMIEAVLGIDNSPSCGVNYVSERPFKRWQEGAGIYIEELQTLLHKKDLHIPFIGVQVYQIDETVAVLRKLLNKEVDLHARQGSRHSQV